MKMRNSFFLFLQPQSIINENNMLNRSYSVHLYTFWL